MYRKLGEAKLLPRIERLSQIKGLRQLPVSSATYGVPDPAIGFCFYPNDAAS